MLGFFPVTELEEFVPMDWICKASNPPIDIFFLKTKMLSAQVTTSLRGSFTFHKNNKGLYKYSPYAAAGLY